MTPHLNLIKARVKKISSYHMQHIGVTAQVEVVEKLAFPHHACWGVACGMGINGRVGDVRLRRQPIEEHWNGGDMDWLDDLIVHELMHLKIQEPCGIHHGPAFKKAMVEYGYHPRAEGWRPGRRIPALE